MIGASEVGTGVDCALCWGLLILVFGERSFGRAKLPVNERRNSLVGRRNIESPRLITLAIFNRSLVSRSGVTGLDILVGLIEFLAVDG